VRESREDKSEGNDRLCAARDKLRARGLDDQMQGLGAGFAAVEDGDVVGPKGVTEQRQEFGQ